MKSVEKVTGRILATAFVFFSGVTVSLAQSGWTPTPGGGGDSDLIGWVRAILIFLVSLSALIAVAILIFNGVKYMTASGDEKKIQDATSGITWAVIGLVVVGIAWLIVNFVINQIIERDPAPASYLLELASRVLG
jgi:hypothetical protein